MGLDYHLCERVGYRLCPERERLRHTVGVSRPKRKRIVLASQAFFTFMTADLDAYERGALWKHLRHACVSPPLWMGEYGSYRLCVFSINATSTSPMLR